MNNKIEIRLGALCDPIEDQLREQGFKFDLNEARNFDKLYESILRLQLAGLVPDSMSEKIKGKLFEKIRRHVMDYNNFKLKNTSIK